jgi:hypothetical protein
MTVAFPTPPAPAERMPMTPRWYVVDSRGVATLCKDEDDANDVAASSFVAFPRHGPYTVALLGDVVAARQEERAKLQALAEQMLCKAKDANWFEANALFERIRAG